MITVCLYFPHLNDHVCLSIWSPQALRDPFEASSCCRAAVHLPGSLNGILNLAKVAALTCRLSLLSNQSEHISHSAGRPRDSHVS